MKRVGGVRLPTGLQPSPYRGRWPHRWLLSLLVGLVVVAGIGFIPDRTVGSAGTPATTSGAPSQIRAAVRGLVSGKIPGAILFVRQGGRSYTVTAGYADKAGKVPMRAGATYKIGSTTKTFTAVLVMRLAAQGKIALNAPISRYLPGLLPGGDRITVRELLQHTSGLYDYEGDARVLAPILAGDLRHPWTPLELITVAVSQPLLFPPGSNFSYSSSNTIVLGLLAERVGGESYGEQLRNYIFGPLKLSHTTLPTDEEGLPDVHGYLAMTLWDKNASPAVVDVTAIAPSPGWSAGAIHSTVQDVANFFRGLLTGKLLPKAEVAEMENTAGTNGRYGLGLMPTGRNAYHWGSYTQKINTTCGRAWGHGGNFPGYYHLPISSPNGSRQAVLLLNADPSLMPQQQTKRVYGVLATAYCRGVPPR